MNIRRLALLLAALLLLAACGSDDQAADTTDATSEPVAAASEDTGTDDEDGTDTSEPAADSAGAAADIAVSDTDLGQVLVDGEGMTLYVFDNDTEGTSNCTGDCAANWPPLTADVTAGDGVDDSLLGSTERDDGSSQVTYDGQPLYYFAGDQAAGDTNGQSVGGIWWVVGPDGAKITDEVSRGDTAPTSDGGY